MTANRSADLAVDDKETRELLWNALDECLRKAAEEETRHEYYDFVQKYLF